MLNEKDLEIFLMERNVEFELLKFEKDVMSSKAAEKQINGIIIKSILLICDDRPILCLLLGKDKIDFEKIKRELNCMNVRLAKAKEVKEITGYDIGAVPPVAHKQKIKTIVDSKVNILNDGEVLYLGGGSHYHLLKIKKRELMKVLQDAKIGSISQ